MGWIKAIFGALSGWVDMQRTKEDQLAGANKVKVAQNDKRDEVRKDAAAIRRKPKRNRLQRNKSKGSR